MGFFSWLGSLLDQLVSWLGWVVKTFLEALLWSLQSIWEAAVKTILIAAYGFSAILYVIFYAGHVQGETIMEVWDPRYYSSKPSQVFQVRQAPKDTPLPKSRSAAKVLTLENWY